MIGLIIIVAGATVAAGIGSYMYVEANTLTLQTTTSMNDSGLLDQIAGPFYGATGIRLRWISAGTGEAVANAAAGNGDVVIVHSLSYEKDFINYSKTGSLCAKGVMRMSFAYNYFILVGPSSNPAGLVAGDSGNNSFVKLWNYGELNPTKKVFASRGDSSGTHTKEKQLWDSSGKGRGYTNATVIPKTWYSSLGKGMADTLTYANEVGAYTLTDYGTWLKTRKQNTALTNLTANPGQSDLLNVYSIICVNPDVFPNVPIKFEMAKQLFYYMLTASQGQAIIENYLIDGERPFIKNITKNCFCQRSNCEVCNGTMCTKLTTIVGCASLKSPTLVLKPVYNPLVTLLRKILPWV